MAVGRTAVVTVVLFEAFLCVEGSRGGPLLVSLYFVSSRGKSEFACLSLLPGGEACVYDFDFVLLDVGLFTADLMWR